MEYKVISPKELKETIRLHGMWLRGEVGGSRADLSEADLSLANLSRANLSWADLSEANLSWADLSEADLSLANLSLANLSLANLSEANLAAPTMFLLASWRKVSDALTTELMRFDADNHPNPKAFTAWAKGGDCPYTGVKWQRCAQFQEKKVLWKPGKCKMSALQLVEALFKEKEIKR